MINTTDLLSTWVIVSILLILLGCIISNFLLIIIASFSTFTSLTIEVIYLHIQKDKNEKHNRRL